MNTVGISSGVRRRAVALAIVAGLLVAACSSATTGGPTSSVAGATATSTATPAATPTDTPSATPTIGPATQRLALAGPAGVTGGLTEAAIRCSQPSLTGLEISVLAQPTDPNLSVMITILAGTVNVRFDSGAGATYVERDFTGTGVTNFDPAKGAQIDTPLAEVPTTGAHGTLGILTSLTGSVDCGNQMPGTSTLTLTGATARGNFTKGLGPVSVECTNGQYGPGVSTIALTQVASTPEELIIYVTPGSFTVSASGNSFFDGFFRSTATATATLTATGAHVDGDAVEQNVKAGAKAHTIHVSGDAVCGTTVAG